MKKYKVILETNITDIIKADRYESDATGTYITICFYLDDKLVARIWQAYIMAIIVVE